MFKKMIPEGLSIWLFLYGGILAVLLSTAFGLPAMLGYGDWFNPLWTIGWGGRELGIGMVALVALFSKEKLVYLAVFVAGTFRELSDVIEAFSVSASTLEILNPAVFLVIDIICVWFTYKAIKAVP